ncbi:unnamed protein product [Rotaria sp. Silwood2]|nr:unnamed protein product [Rotaria sp. Silwood2]CAF4439120.1 unnamed protein product [Rotaria sp. Silwood2]CAF4574212.1 unnamed protein product [Rotaria sp. Silwood2]
MQNVADFHSVDAETYLIKTGFFEDLNPKADTTEHVFSTITLENPALISSSSELFEKTMTEEQAVLRSLEEELQNIEWELPFPTSSNPAKAATLDNPKHFISSDRDDLLNDSDQQENYSQNQHEVVKIGETPTAENDVLYKNPHGSLLEQQLFIKQIDETESMNHNLSINDISVGTTGIEKNPTDKCKPTKVIKSSDIPLTSTFHESGQSVLISNAKPMVISVAPCPYQRARYVDECSNANRHIFVPWDGIFTLIIPDLRSSLPAGVTVWLRITRITLKHGTSGLILVHPYPIWINNDYAKVHDGSLYIPVTEQDMANGFIKIEYLTMLRLRQCDLANMKTLAIYSQTQLMSTSNKKVS